MFGPKASWRYDRSPPFVMRKFSNHHGTLLPISEEVEDSSKTEKSLPYSPHIIFVVWAATLE